MYIYTHLLNHVFIVFLYFYASATASRIALSLTGYNWRNANVSLCTDAAKHALNCVLQASLALADNDATAAATAR